MLRPNPAFDWWGSGGNKLMPRYSGVAEGEKYFILSKTFETLKTISQLKLMGTSYFLQVVCGST